MNEIHRDAWRETRAPPADGLTRLIDAVEASRASHLRWPWRFALVGTCVTAALFAVFGFTWQAHRNSPEYRFRQALETALRPTVPTQSIQVENGAALEIPSADPNVRIYWIAQLPTATAESRHD